MLRRNSVYMIHKVRLYLRHVISAVLMTQDATKPKYFKIHEYQGYRT